MTRQETRIDRERAGAAEADRIISDAIDRAWERIRAREEDEADE
jgi:hypothetical protein